MKTKNRLINIILLPLKLLSKLKSNFIFALRKLKFSIRNKILFDFLFLYVIFYLISVSIVVIMFLYLNVNNVSKDVEKDVTSAINVYELGKTGKNKFQINLNAISYSYGVSLRLEKFQNDEFVESFITKNFMVLDYPNSALGKILYLFKYKIIAKQGYKYEDVKEATSSTSYLIYQMHDYRSYGESIKILLLILLLVLVLTFFMLGVIGGARVKKVLKPIYNMTRVAENISVYNMDQRINVLNTKYELRDLAMTFNDMLDRLNRGYLRQKRFVSDVSHELRTPISIIKGYGNLISRWGSENQQVLDESISAILDETDNMQILVENLLTLVRSDNQTLQFEIEEVNVSEIVRQSVKEALLVNKKKQKITSHIEDKLISDLDYAKVKQCIRILIDNAIKYTDEGGEIRVSCYKENNYIYISVLDSGMGIDEKNLPFIFDRFYRSDESRTRLTGGHGLGLSIAKAIVTGQSGKIRVRSKLGVASEFTIIFKAR